MNISRSTISMDAASPSRRKVILIRNAYSFDFGGAERFVVALSKELHQYDWDPIIVTAHKNITKHAIEEGQAVRKGPWWPRQDFSGAKLLLFPLYLLWQLYLTCWYLQLFARLKPDVVHPQSRDDFIGATLASILLGKRVIWTDHADLKYIYQNASVLYKNLVGKLVRWCSQFASTITLVSKSEANLISSELGIAKLPSNYQVVYNGITDRSINPEVRSPEDREAIAFCITSRLVTAKGVGELIDAFMQIDQINYRLWILGEGPEEQKFKQQADDHPRIRFLGFPPNSLNILKSADIFVHPSYHEGFSISILEAAMLGMPIVACRTGGNPEIVEDKKNGLLVPVKNTERLAAAMQTLAEKKDLRKRYAAAARQTYLDSFQFDKIVKEEFIPLYEK